MTTPAPVQAYAAVSPDGRFYCAYPSEPAAVDATIRNPTITAREMLSITNVPVTILLTEQHAAMVAALEWYEEKVRLCNSFAKQGDEARDSLARDGGGRALRALAALKEQSDG